MNERVADRVDLVGRVDLSDERSVGAIEPRASRAEENEAREELVDYMAVPPRCSQKLRVRFRQGARLPPLPYPLDEENP
jgi:hypothetical protein